MLRQNSPHRRRRGDGGGGPSSTYYTITAKSDVGSKISPLSTRVKKGADAAFTISAIENYAIDTVMLDKTNVTADLVAKGTNEWTYTLKDVRGTHTITVTSKLATLDDYQYKVKVSAGDFDFNTNYYNGNELILAALNQELPVIVKNDRFISYLNKANAKLQEKADSFVYDGQKVKNAEELLDIAVKQMDSILIDQIGLTKSSAEYTAWKALQPSEAEITGDYISSLIESYWAMVRATQESGKLEARKAKFANLDMEEIVQAELQKIGYAYTAKDTIDRSMDYDFSIEGQSISGSVTVNVPIEIPVTLGIDPTSYRFTGEVVTTGTLGTKTFTEINDFTHYMAENFLYENPTIKDFIVKYGENVAITGQGEATAYVMEKDNAEAKAQMIEDIVAKVVANVEPQIIAAHPELSDKDITADLTSEIKNKMGDYINDTLTDALNTTRTKTINEKHIVIEVTKGTI